MWPWGPFQGGGCTESCLTSESRVAQRRAARHTEIAACATVPGACRAARAPLRPRGGVGRGGPTGDQTGSRSAPGRPRLRPAGRRRASENRTEESRRKAAPRARASRSPRPHLTRRSADRVLGQAGGGHKDQGGDGGGRARGSEGPDGGSTSASALAPPRSPPPVVQGPPPTRVRQRTPRASGEFAGARWRTARRRLGTAGSTLECGAGRTVGKCSPSIVTDGLSSRGRGRSTG